MKKNQKLQFRIGLLVTTSLCLGFLGGVLADIVGLSDVLKGGQQAPQPVVLSGDDVVATDISNVVAEVMPSVVSVSAVVELPDPQFFDPRLGEFVDPSFTEHQVSGGTGFILSENGLVMTNRHVLQAAPGATFKVSLYDGSEYPVEVLDVDEKEDVAILKIQSEDKFEGLYFGDSESLKVGQPVFAIGNALAVYGNSVTSGVVSAVGRNVAAYNDSGNFVENLSGLIQTDAAINLGNSGGPLFNLEGEVVGMNVAVAQANDIGFAIPADELKPIIASVEEFGEIQRPILGVRFVTLDAAQVAELDSSLSSGAALLLSDMSRGEYAVNPNGPADMAGVKELDLILAVDGEELSLQNPLHKVIRDYTPGNIVLLKLWRDGETLEIEVTLGSSKEL